MGTAGFISSTEGVLSLLRGLGFRVPETPVALEKPSILEAFTGDIYSALCMVHNT